MPQATSMSLVANLMVRMTSPARRRFRAEVQVKVQETLNGMDPIDREMSCCAISHYPSQYQTVELAAGRDRRRVGHRLAKTCDSAMIHTGDILGTIRYVSRVTKRSRIVHAVAYQAKTLLLICLLIP